MKMMKLGKSEINVSRICYGAFGVGGGTAWGDCDDATSIEVIHKALERGMNYIDTAPVYGIGHSEELLAKALKGKRDKVILQTKCTLNWREPSNHLEYTRNGISVYRDLSANAIKKDLEDCLSRPETDYIDIFVTHRQMRAVPVEESMGALLELKKEGKIRGIGISNAETDILEEYLKFGPVEVWQEEYNLLNAHARQNYVDCCEQNGVTLQAFSPLARGMLTGAVKRDTEYPDGDVRKNFNWFQQDNRGHIIDVLEKWEPVCKKYNCSMSCLALAWTFNKVPSINLICGMRKMSSLMDTLSIDSFDWDSADFLEMSKDIEVLNGKLRQDLGANR